MSKKHINIVIVTYNWPPRNAVGTHRPYSWAKYWSEMGAAITVLTAMKCDFDAPLDLDLPNLNDVKVMEIPFQSPGGIFRLLAVPVIRSWAKKLKGWLNAHTRKSIDVRAGWANASKAVARDLAQSADVIVSTYGPAASHIIAAAMKAENPNALWVADYRDPWSQNTRASFSVQQRSTEYETEMATVGRCADLVTTVSVELAQELQDLVGKQVVCVENGYDIPDDQVINNLDRNYIKNDGPLRIVYTGIIYPEHQNIKPLLQALAHLRLFGRLPPGGVVCDFYGSRVDSVKALAKDPAYADFIRLHGHVPRSAALTAQRDADLLLLLESPSPDARGILTGKVFEYLASGRPILSLGSVPGSAIHSILKSTGAGQCAGEDVNLIADILSQMRPGCSPAWFRPNRDVILRHSRKARANEFMDAIRSALKGRSDAVRPMEDRCNLGSYVTLATDRTRKC